MKVAPIALFVYNRPDHAKATVEHLARNEYASESDLFVFSDGPKNEAAKEKVEAVRAYARTITGFKSVTSIERSENNGLARSIIAGVTDITSKFERVIVVEDDLVSSPYFLRFMNEGLEYYANDGRVASIHGYIYPVAGKLPETFFLRGADCWGWATWKRAWSLFEPDGSKLLARLKETGQTRIFDFNDTYGYTRMLEDQIAGRNNSWAIRWHASAFLAEKLTLYPGRSLIHNIGFDESGTHCGEGGEEYSVLLSKEPVRVGGIEVAESREAFAEIERYRRAMMPVQQGLFRRVAKKIMRLFGK